MKIVIIFAAIAMLALPNGASALSQSQTSPEVCFDAYCSNDDPFGDEYQNWLQQYLFESNSIGGFGQSGMMCYWYNDCPGISGEECRQYCAGLYESRAAGCRALNANPFEKAICWAQAAEDYAQCLRNC